MNVFEKIKLWFTSISKVVNFLINTYKDAEVLADKKANFKTWADFVIAFIKDALQYADEIAALAQSQPVQTKGQVIKAVKQDKAISTNFQTAFFREKAQNFNK
ncbi:MAG: hypothetical protein WC319_12920 [Candidatus Paceibacterota bacterium]|jgi:hypothetical protein